MNKELIKIFHKLLQMIDCTETTLRDQLDDLNEIRDELNYADKKNAQILQTMIELEDIIEDVLNLLEEDNPAHLKEKLIENIGIMMEMFGKKHNRTIHINKSILFDNIAIEEKETTEE